MWDLELYHKQLVCFRSPRATQILSQRTRPCAQSLGQVKRIHRCRYHGESRLHSNTNTQSGASGVWRDPFDDVAYVTICQIRQREKIKRTRRIIWCKSRKKIRSTELGATAAKYNLNFHYLQKIKAGSHPPPKCYGSWYHLKILVHYFSSQFTLFKWIIFCLPH